MFLDNQEDYLEARLFSTHYLGRLSVFEAVFSLLKKQTGTFEPQRWGTDERTKNVFEKQSVAKIEEEWMREESMKEICLSGKRPEFLLCFSIERFPRAKFNSVLLFIREQAANNLSQAHELLDFIIELGSIVKADYGFIAHTKQERRQSPILTPAERLPGIYWANLFGRPYMEFFGQERLLATPCHEVRLVNEDLVLLLTAERPDAPELINSDDAINSVKTYLDYNAFAGPNFPDEPCSVPAFDFSDLRTAAVSDSDSEQTPRERVARLRRDLQSRGYTAGDEVGGLLTFTGSDGSVVRIDIQKGEINFDSTRQN